MVPPGEAQLSVTLLPFTLGCNNVGPDVGGWHVVPTVSTISFDTSLAPNAFRAMTRT
jgi:hypothetical protein